MTIKEIVKSFLTDNDFDGLYNPGECACLKDDLFPCGEPSEWCEAGYKAPCDCGDHDWHVQLERPLLEES